MRKLKNEESARAQGFFANYAFVTDKHVCPDGIDIMPVNTIAYQEGTQKEMLYEVSILNKDGSVTFYENITQKDISSIVSKHNGM